MRQNGFTIITLTCALRQWLPSSSDFGGAVRGSGSGEIRDCAIIGSGCSNGGVAGGFRFRASPNGSFTFALVNDVAATHHVVNCGFFFMVGVSVLARGTGVVGIGAESMAPAVVESKR